MDPRDFELLQQIANGTRHFRPDPGQEGDASTWLQKVERLRRLRRTGYIRVPEPERYYMQKGYSDIGPCELTAEGWDALEKFGP